MNYQIQPENFQKIENEPCVYNEKCKYYIKCAEEKLACKEFYKYCTEFSKKDKEKYSKRSSDPKPIKKYYDFIFNNKSCK